MGRRYLEPDGYFHWQAHLFGRGSEIFFEIDYLYCDEKGMRRNRTLFLILLLSLWGCLSPPGQTILETPKPTAGGAIVDERTNIHFTGKYCGQCHEGTPVKGGDARLKYNGDYQLLCGRCHRGLSPGYCHPLEINQDTDRKLTMPAGFPLRDGKFTCETCHDMYRQCVKRRFDRFTLRGAPYPRRTDFCYRCHTPERYQPLNAHHQIQDNGMLDDKMCLYCHSEEPDEKTATYKDVTFIGDTRDLCHRCHPVEGNHPGNFNHMAAAPSAKSMKHMAVLEKRFGIILPLARDGKMTCITCHNPHQKGVIAADKPSARGADSKYRERLPQILCIECHKM